VREVFEAFDKMKDLCRLLKADILHLQTPPSFRLDDAFTIYLRQLLLSLNLGRLRLALEVRGTSTGSLPNELLKTMQDNNMIHCVDLSKGEMPAYESDTLYSRLFGKGQHNIYQPTDEELAGIDRQASNSKSDKIAMSFHFVRMYKDAARLKTYKQSGKFPMITGSTGAASVEQVLSEDVVFPASKQDLVREQGWKLFDVTMAVRARVGEYLERLPDRTYDNLAEVTGELAQIIGC
jgi:uncharacterized protein YecE (DUF72 family)